MNNKFNNNNNQVTSLVSLADNGGGNNDNNNNNNLNKVNSLVTLADNNGNNTNNNDNTTNLVDLDAPLVNHFSNELLYNTLTKYISKADLKWFYDEGVDIGEKVVFIQRMVENLDSEIKLINNRGFVPGFELNNIKRFPLTSKFLKDVIGYKPQKDPSMPAVKWEIDEIDELSKVKLVRWWFNIIQMDMYLILTCIKESPKFAEELNDDTLEDIKVLCNEKKNTLESYIRLSLSRGGISINQNIYTGFDTEYVNVSEEENELLSVQLMVTSRLVLKFPRVLDFYEVCGVNTVTNEVYTLNQVNKYIDLDYVNENMNLRIKFLRSILYPGFDDSISKLIKGLKEMGVKSIIKDECTYFMFEKGLLKSWFTTDVSKGVSLVSLINKSNEMTYEELDIQTNKLWDLLKEIFSLKDYKSAEVIHNDLNSFLNENEVNEDLEVDVVNEEVGEGIEDTEGIEDVDEIEVDKEEVTVNEDKEDKEKENEANEKGKSESKSNFDFDSNSFSGDNVSEHQNVNLIAGGEINSGKKYIRTYKQSFTTNKVSVTIKKQNFLLGHYNSADLSMLSDFNTFKHELDIVNKVFVTLRKPLLINGINVIFRDTMLLAPGGNKSLKNIGSLYNINKIDIGNNINNMKIFLKNDYEGFKEYAIQDAKIALVHGLYMEEFSFQFGLISIPLSLSMLSSVYLRKCWKDIKYDGYQLNPEYYVNDSAKSQTPKGLFFTGDIGLHMSYYISNYKGGRNESFMYGIDDKFKWYDYDLISAYTTGMSIMYDPNYWKAKPLSRTVLKGLKDDTLLMSYVIIKGNFEFPESVKFPSIPCYMDETTTIYPRKGSCMLTGAEYLLALEQNCRIDVEGSYFIPIREVDDKKGGAPVPKPFYEVIKVLQSNRAKYPKGTINNLLYKELGNSIYGLVVRGISNKRKFDIRSKQTVRMEGNDLSNPIIASWITAFIRSVIGEMLHNVNLLGGKVVSVTTDGFITDIPDLESKLLKLKKGNKLLMAYRDAREALFGNPSALELKNSGTGLMSWTTRGQFSKEGLMAATGFQRGLYKPNEIDALFREGLNSEGKDIVFINRRLKSAMDVYKHGGNITMEYRDQVFRLMHDNKRKMIVKGKDNGVGIVVPDSPLNGFYDSNPLADIKEGILLRYLVKRPYFKKYQKRLSTKVFKNQYKNVLEIMVRNFIRCLLTNSMNLINEFKDYNEIIEYINSYDKSIKLTPNIIAQLKRRPSKPKKLYYDDVVNNFIDYVLIKFPDFDKDKFFNEYSVIKVKEEVDSTKDVNPKGEVKIDEKLVPTIIAFNDNDEAKNEVAIKDNKDEKDEK